MSMNRNQEATSRNGLRVFENADFGSIRGLTIDGEPWVVGKDVAAALGYSNTKDAIAAHVDEEDKQVVQRSENATFDIPNRGLTVINESGVYGLVFGSKLPSAKQFKRWVTSEVLPAIRKAGGYTARPKPDKNVCSLIKFVGSRDEQQRDLALQALEQCGFDVNRAAREKEQKKAAAKAETDALCQTVLDEIRANKSYARRKYNGIMYVLVPPSRFSNILSEKQLDSESFFAYSQNDMRIGNDGRKTVVTRTDDNHGQTVRRYWITDAQAEDT